jgi:pimeloyl-ACP methyl ester carboxylesterase
VSLKDTAAAPSALLMVLEGRALAEFAAHRLRWTFLRDLPRGDRHPVLIVPGFGASDAATAPLRRVLERLGYNAYGWDQGRNLGMRPPIKEGLRTRLHKLHERHQAKVSLIGWSLGGVFVREMARHAPQYVRRVITLGSPINGHPGANNLMGLFKLINRGKPVNLDLEGFRRRIVAPPVPCTAIYTRRDGIVSWECCLEDQAPNTENIEVSGSHLGLPYNPQVIRVIADRLARPDVSTQ